MNVLHGRKGGASEAHVPVEAPDSVQSVARAKMLVALGEGEFAGELDGTRIFLDDTPLTNADGTENFPGVKWEFRPGTQHQEYIQGLPSAENEITVGTELRSGTPWVKAVTNAELSAVRLRVSWPSLQQQNDQGDVHGYRIDYVIELSTAGGGWVEVLAATINDKTTTKYERSHRIDLPASDSGWTVRIRRLTENQDSNKIADTMRVEAITEVIDAKLRYPNTALLYVEFDASQFQSIPKISCEPKMRMVRVPSNYDAATRTYSGIWDGTFQWAWTDNPAWVLYDIVLSGRFGMGRRLDQTMVDRWGLYEIAQYCDELVSDGKGGMEPRFTCNVYIQDQADAWEVLRDIAAIFRGVTYWAGDKVLAQSDMPSDVEYVFSRSSAKVQDGKITYSGQSERTRYTSVLVGWDNPQNNYESEPEAVSIPALVRRYGYNKTEITAIGCTRQSEANRRGRWLLLTNSSDRSITFRTGLEGYLPKPGRIIGMADAFLAGRQLAGRISQASARQLTLDRDCQVKQGDRLLVNLPSGITQARTVQSVAGRVVTVTAEYSEVPRPQAQWGVDADDLAIQRYRVTSVSRTDDGFEISGVLIDPEKYAAIDSGTRLESKPISVAPARTQDAPAGVAVTSYTRTEQGRALTTMRAQWEAAKGAIAYVAEWRKDSGAWVSVPRTSGLGFEVAGIYAGRYLVRVRAVNALDAASIAAYSDETVLNGKEGAPPALSSLTAASLVWGIGLKWGFPDGADDTRYTEIQQNIAAEEEGATLLGLYPYPQTAYDLTGLAAGAKRWLRARLVDTTGNVGPWTAWVLGVASTDAGQVIDLIAGEIDESVLSTHLRGRIDLIDGNGEGSVNQRLKELAENIGNLADALLYDTARTYGPGDVVRQGQRLYQAVTAVPAGDNAPPDATYWLDIGTVVETANGLALQVQQNTAGIEELDGVVTAAASQLRGLQAAYRDDDGTGDIDDAVQGWSTQAKISENYRVLASADKAIAERITQLEADLGDDLNARITDIEQTIVENGTATAQHLEQLEATAGKNSAAIEQAAKVQAGLEGDLLAMWSLKLQVNSAGQYVFAGIGAGIENTPGGLQSTLLFTANQIAFANPTTPGAVDYPFIMKNGQNFLGTTFIEDGTITSAKVGDLSSDNWSSQKTGWKFFKAGSFEMNNGDGTGRVSFNGDGFKIYSGAVDVVTLGRIS